MSHPQGSTEEQQREDRDRAVYAACFAVDTFVHDNDDLRRVTAATHTKLVVEAAVGYLLGEGLIVVKPANEWPDMLGFQIRPHLLPDVAHGVAELAQINEALRR